MSDKTINLDQPTRLHMGGMAIFFALFVKTLLGYLWPVFAINLFKGDENRMWLLILSAVIIAIAIAHALLEYFNFTFQISNNELTVRSGYIRKKEVFLPLNGIQSLNMKQNVVQQVFSIYTLEVNTAGSKGAEISLKALDISTIHEIERIVSLVSSQRKEENEQLEVSSEEAAARAKVEESTIVTLSIKDLLRIGITNNHTKVILIMYGFVFGLYNDLPKHFQNVVADVIDSVATRASNQLTIYLTLGLICAIIFAVVATTIATFAWYYNLKLSSTSSRLVLNAGLVTHKRILIPFNKVQTLKWISNPLRKLLGIYSVTIGQASSAVETEKMKANIPGCTSKQVEQVQQMLFSTTLVDEPATIYRSHWIYLRNLWLLAGVVPAAIFTIIGIATSTEPMMWSGIWAVIYMPFAYLSWKHRYFYTNGEHIVASSGSVGHQRCMFAISKIQGASLRQSIWQKAKGRATLTLYLAGETVNLPHIDAEVATHLRDYALFIAESKGRR